FACYCGILLLWPYDEGSRYLLPLAPLLWVYLFAGSRTLLDAVRRQSRAVRFVGMLWSVTGLAGFAAAVGMVREQISKQDLASAGFWAILLLALVFFWRRIASRPAAKPDQRLGGWAPVAIACYVLAVFLQVGPMIVRRAGGQPPTEPVARERAEEH